MGNPVWGAHVLEERNRVETYISSRLFSYSVNTFLLSVSYIRAKHDSRYWRYDGEQDLIP